MTTNPAASDPRPALGFGPSFRRQAWLLGLSRRWLWLALGLIAIPGMIGLGTGGLGHGTTLSFGLIAVFGATFWALAVWAGEGPNRRTYHWSLPVHRPSHDLARVAAGALWLLGVCAIVAAAGLLIDILNGTFTDLPDEVTAPAYGPGMWAAFFAAPLILYLLVSPLLLWRDYRVTAWILIVAAVLPFFVVVLGSLGLDLRPLGRLIDATLGNDGLGNALMGGTMRVLAGGAEAPPAEPWWPDAAVWLAVGLALTGFTAAFRPDDLRRRVRPG